MYVLTWAPVRFGADITEMILILYELLCAAAGFICVTGSLELEMKFPLYEKRYHRGLERFLLPLSYTGAEEQAEAALPLQEGPFSQSPLVPRKLPGVTNTPGSFPASSWRSRVQHSLMLFHSPCRASSEREGAFSRTRETLN